MARDLGWAYFEKLAQQSVMQVQSASDPPKKLALGERAVQADGNEYNLFQLKEQGQPVEPVYAGRGHAADRRAERRVQERAEPERGAAVPELVLHARSASSSSSTSAALRSLHPQAKEKPGRKPLKDIKTMKEDAAAVEKQSDEIKTRYSKMFKV